MKRQTSLAAKARALVAAALVSALAATMTFAADAPKIAVALGEGTGGWSAARAAFASSNRVSRIFVSQLFINDS